MEVVRHQIRALRYKNTDGKWFIPDELLVSGLPYEIIQNSLQNHCEVEPYGVEWMAQAVQNGARKVFAILILIREEKKITAFLEQYLQSDGQTLDSRLPFSLSELDKIFPRAVASEFEEEQWGLIAPVFTHRLLHRNIPTEFTLPFIESRKLGEGGFGDVYEVVIPAGHHNFKDIDRTKHARIVRKELRKDLGDDDLWIKAGFNEHQIMSYLYHLEHPNILPLLTSYTYSDVPNFLLPLADGGDLEQLLNVKHRPKDFAEDTRFYDALSGLASALDTLHDYKSDVFGTEMIGYHHDLKPKNVLVAGGRFVLSDFGLSKLKTGEDSRTPFKKGQGHYLAPECEDLEHDFSKGVVSRASDVWSLGCIVLEVIVYMVGGTDAVANFREHRTIKKGFLTTKTFFCGKALNPEVERKMFELTGCENVSVRKAVVLTGQILVVDLKKRLKASEICLRLRLICFEASYLRLCAAFQSTTWRIDNPEVIAGWNSFCQMAHNLALGDDKIAFDSLEAKDLEHFADRTHVERLLRLMEGLLDFIVSSDLCSDVASQILLFLQQINDVLSLQLGGNQRCRGLENEATHSETDLHHDTPRLINVNVESERVRNLKWDDCAFTAVTSAVRNATISRDERFLAVEYDWQITVYALPSGEEVQKIKTPNKARPFRRSMPNYHPELAFSPDGKNLIVSWIRYVHVYRVGHDENKESCIFPYYNRDAWRTNDDSVIKPFLVMLAAISPDSTKVALHSYKAESSDYHLIHIIGLTENKAADGEMFEPTLHATQTIEDFANIFEFSPDGCHLAISEPKTFRYKKDNAVLIQLLDINHTGTEQLLSTRWFTLCCAEKLLITDPHRKPVDARAGIVIRRSSEFFWGSMHPRLVFGVWAGRWVAGVWGQSKQALALHDLHSQSHLASIDLSCLDAFNSGITNAIFSGNLGFAASHKSPGSAILRKFKRGEKTSANLITLANTKSNQVICVLECIFFDHYWLSNSGQYALLRKKDELRVFRLLED